MPNQTKPSDRERGALFTCALRAAISGICQAVTRWLLDQLS
ncbi:hypothetical protein [Amycolatopsis lexingtonensis]